MLHLLTFRASSRSLSPVACLCCRRHRHPRCLRPSFSLLLSSLARCLPHLFLEFHHRPSRLSFPCFLIVCLPVYSAPVVPVNRASPSLHPRSLPSSPSLLLHLRASESGCENYNLYLSFSLTWQHNESLFASRHSPDWQFLSSKSSLQTPIIISSIPMISVAPRCLSFSFSL